MPVRKAMRMRCVTGAPPHRTSAPIIVPLDAQPAAKSAEAVGGGSLLLHLPRHGRPLPAAGARPAERRASASPARTSRSGPRTSPCSSSRVLAVRGCGARTRARRRSARRLGGIRRADRRVRARERRRRAHGGRQARRARRADARRRRVRRHAGAARRRSSPSSSPSRASPSPGPRSSSSVQTAAGRARSWASTISPRSRPWRSRSVSRGCTPAGPSAHSRSSGVVAGVVGVVLGASLASLLGLYLAARRDRRRSPHRDASCVGRRCSS